MCDHVCMYVSLYKYVYVYLRIFFWVSYSFFLNFMFHIIIRFNHNAFIYVKKVQVLHRLYTPQRLYKRCFLLQLTSYSLMLGLVPHMFGAPILVRETGWKNIFIIN